jgi:hypothetical protein
MSQMTIPPFKKKDSQGQGGVDQTSNMDIMYDDMTSSNAFRPSNANNLALFGLEPRPLGNIGANGNQNMDFGLRLLQQMNTSNVNNDSSLFQNTNMLGFTYQNPSAQNNNMTTSSLGNDIDLRFSDQLLVLHDMGFNNDELNKRALLASVIIFLYKGWEH